MMRAPRSAAAILVLVLALPLSAEGEAPALAEGRAALLAAAREEGAASYAQALALALSREAAAAGIRAAAPLILGYEAREPEAAMEAAAAEGARWVLVASCALEGSRLVWRASVYDGADGSLLGSDGFAAYAGLTALPQLERSAAAAVAASRLGSGGPPEREAAIDWRLVFASKAEGARVRLGGAEAEDLPLGEIEGGRLEAPYLPLKPGQRILVGLESEGAWPATKSFVVAEEGEELALPPLMRKTRAALSLNYGTARYLGAAAALRWYPLPDMLYLRAEDSLWCAYDFRPGARPVFHDELRLGCGAYLIFPPRSRFRISAGLGLSAIASWIASSGLDRQAGFDLCLEPFFYTLEWHWPGWALVLEQRFPYSLGVGSGYLERAWLQTADHQPFLSLGVLLKWR